MLLELLLTAFTILFIWDYFHKRRHNAYFEKYKISGPKAYPILGSAWELRRTNTENVFEIAGENRAKYGKIFRIWVLHQINVVVMDAKYLEAILSSQQLIKKSSLYDFLIGWLGTGLLLSSGKKWHTRRKIITPTFHFKILEEFVEVFDRQSALLVKCLREKADGKTAINIFPSVCLSALDVIAETAMGVKVHAQENLDNEYVRAVASVARIMANRFIKPAQRTDWLFRFTAPSAHRELRKSIAILHKFTNNVIEQRRAALTESQHKHTTPATANVENDADIGAKKRLAFLDVLLQSTVDGKPLSNEDIREEVDTFMFEGHDTTTSGISFCLYEISRHPAVQQQLVAEIQQVLGTDKDQPISYRALQDLKYLECVIKETLRLYPSVPAIGRETTEDIAVADIVLPAKTNLSLSLFMAMRDPDYFSEPNEFKPERFANEANAHKINTFTYVPFSAGPRNCIGQKFAMLEMKSTISKLLRHYELLPLGPPPRPMVNVILRSANGVHIGLKPRVA